MCVISHLSTTALFFCFIFTKLKAPPPTKQKHQKNNHTCKIERKSAPSENIRSAEIMVLKHRESSQVWPDYRFFSFFYFQLEKQNKSQQMKQTIQN